MFGLQLISVNHRTTEESPKTGVRATARTPVFGDTFNFRDFLNFRVLLDLYGLGDDYGHDQVSDQDARAGQEESQHKQ